jgi:SulP family sulfate permease
MGLAEDDPVHTFYERHPYPPPVRGLDGERSPRKGELIPAAETVAVPGMLLLRIEGGLYTLNIRRVQADICTRVATAVPRPSVVVLDVGGTADTSVTVMDIIVETDRHLAKDGVALWVAAIPSRALVKAKRTEAWSAWVATGKLHRTVADAVGAHQHATGSEAG